MAKQRSALETKHLVQTEGPDIEQSAQAMYDSRQYKYLMVNIIARRARELNKGAKPLVKLTPPYTTTEVAIAEMEAGLLDVEEKKQGKVMVNLVENE